MPYDILLVRRRPGRTVPETLDEQSAEFFATYDPKAGRKVRPLRLDPEQRAAWERVIGRISDEVGAVAVTAYPETLDAWREGPASFFGLHYSGEKASIEIPYRYPDESALTVMTEAYQVARIVEDETGLEGYDFEVDQDVRTGNVKVAAARLAGVAHWAWDNLS
ncbi:hypothetical protein [Plantactinospora sp. B5E13]|uniref:hypothetical protein n=1 Tax=Plantactinospora sp. B5E13 TaxID=3153758 RepID=UPI00325C85CC